MINEEIKKTIKKAIPGARVIIPDNDGTHFEAVVISEDFMGKSLVQQHRMVMAALAEHLKERIHALSLKTYTPEQYAKLNRH